MQKISAYILTFDEAEKIVHPVPRRSFMKGQWIHGSGWYPNFRQPQLFRKGSMRYTLEPAHEGHENRSGKPVGTLQNAIWQFPFRNLSEIIRKADRYSSLGATKLAGKPVSMAGAFFGHGVWSFLNTTFSSVAPSTAGPASSSHSATSKECSIATPNA
jgi:hypothetical protein